MKLLKFPFLCIFGLFTALSVKAMASTVSLEAACQAISGNYEVKMANQVVPDATHKNGLVEWDSSGACYMSFLYCADESLCDGPRMFFEDSALASEIKEADGSVTYDFQQNGNHYYWKTGSNQWIVPDITSPGGGKMQVIFDLQRQ